MLTIGIFISIPIYNSYYEKMLKEKGILHKFGKDDAYQMFLPKQTVENLKPERRMNFTNNQSILSVVVGNSGIGKTAEICQYAKELREAGHPVIYIHLSKETNYNFKALLEEIFGTSDKEIIIQTTENNYTKKDIVPTLIIDNIHYAVINDKIDQDLLTFFNGQFYQGLKMAIIMLASVNGAAHEMNECNFFIGFFLYFKK